MAIIFGWYSFSHFTNAQMLHRSQYTFYLEKTPVSSWKMLTQSSPHVVITNTTGYHNNVTVPPCTQLPFLYLPALDRMGYRKVLAVLALLVLALLLLYTLIGVSSPFAPPGEWELEIVISNLNECSKKITQILEDHAVAMNKTAPLPTLGNPVPASENVHEEVGCKVTVLTSLQCRLLLRFTKIHP